MTIADVSIPYPDFKLLDVIEPDQFDLNNSTLVSKINTMLDVLNQITDSVTDGGSGADAISLTSIAPFASVKVQAFLEEVVARLQASTDGVSGADLLGSTTIAGVTGSTVQAQLESLKAILDANKTAVESRTTALEGRATSLETRATSVEGRATSLEGRMTTGETNITSNATNLTNHKGSTDHDGRYYTKGQVDTKVFGTANVADLAIITSKIGNESITLEKIHPTLKTTIGDVAVNTRFLDLESDMVTLEGKMNPLPSQNTVLNRGKQILNVTNDSLGKVIDITGETIVNLAPLFDSGLWGFYLSANVVINGNEITRVSTTDSESSYVLVSVKANTDYIFAAEHNQEIAVYNFDGTIAVIPFTTNQSILFNSGSNTSIRLYFNTRLQGIGNSYYARNITLNEGATALPFVANVKGVTNPTLTVKGENLIEGYGKWNKHANAVMEEWYKLTHTPTFTALGTETVTHTAVDKTVVGSAYDTSGNGGRKIDSNSTDIFTVEKDSTKVYVQKRNKSTGAFDVLFTSPVYASVQDVSIVATDSAVYLVVSYNNVSVEQYHINPNTGVLVGAVKPIDSVQTALGNVSLAINEAGTELHATWSSKNATYPNSFNIRYAKGTISAVDGSVTWGSVEQVSTQNSTAYQIQNPSIFFDGNAPYILTDVKWDTSYMIAVYSKKSELGGSFGANASAGWYAKQVYGGSTYAQSSPSSIFVPQEIAIKNALFASATQGVIITGWHGTDSTDTTYNNIHLAYSLNGGINWTDIKLTIGNTNNRNAPSVTVTKGGKIHVYYQNSANTSLARITHDTVSWGVESVIKTAIGNNPFPSTLIDFTVDITEPLFIYKDATKVGFYGTWDTIEEIVNETTFEDNTYDVGIVPNTLYTMSWGVMDASLLLSEVSASGTVTPLNSGNPISGYYSFTSSATADKLRITFRVNTTGKKTFYRPVLNVGNTALPFKENDDTSVTLLTTLHEGEKVSVDGNGQAVKMANVKEVVLDGSLPWTDNGEGTGFKIARVPKIGTSINASTTSKVVKYNGKLLKYDDAVGIIDSYKINEADGYIYLNIPNTDTGFGDSYPNPTADEWKAFFLGWKMYPSAGAYTDLYTSGQKAWCYRKDDGVFGYGQSTLPTTQAPISGFWQPYRLIYDLATPQPEAIKMIGSLKLHEGGNQVEVSEGRVVREKAIPNSGGYISVDNSQLKYRNKNIIQVYKNGVEFNALSINTRLPSDTINLPYGDQYVQFNEGGNFDKTAVYEVDYIPSELYKVTAPTNALTLEYQANLGSVVSQLVDDVTDVELRTGVLENSVVRKGEGVQWISVTLLNGYSGDARFSKDSLNNVKVYLELLNGTKTNGTVIMVFPKGFRPKYNEVILAQTNTTTPEPAKMLLTTDGQLKVVDSFLTYSQANFIFKAEQ